MKDIEPLVHITSFRNLGIPDAVHNLMLKFHDNVKNNELLTIDRCSTYNDLITSFQQSFNYKQIDADVFMFNTPFSVYNMKVWNQNLFNYFSSFMTMYMMHNPSWYTINDLLNKDGNVFKYRINEEFISALYSDIVIIPGQPIMDKILELAKKTYSDAVINKFKEKVFCHGYIPDVKYDFKDYNNIENYKTIKFIWHHRMTIAKNYRLFNSIINQLHTKYPDVNFEVHICSESNKLEFIPGVKFIYHGLVPKNKMFEILNECNCSIMVTQEEACSASMFESCNFNHVCVSLKSEPYLCTFGNKYQFKNVDEICDNIITIFNDHNLIKENIQHHKNVADTMVDPTTFFNELNAFMTNKLEQKIDRKYHESRIRNSILQLIEKNDVVNKQQIFEHIGWNVSNTQFWGSVYYSLRKFGVQVNIINGTSYYYLDENNISKLNEQYFI